MIKVALSGAPQSLVTPKLMDRERSLSVKMEKIEKSSKVELPSLQEVHLALSDTSYSGAGRGVDDRPNFQA